MKKAQMELIGIAIVVILISLGILFMLSFGISKKGTSFKQEFTNKELVSNTLSTMLRVKALGCGDLTIEDLLQDCFLTESVNCGSEDEPKMSCNYMNETMDEIFDRTLDKWGRSYFLDISRADNVKIHLDDGKGCLADGDMSYEGMRWHDIDTDAYWIPLDPGTIQIRIGLCSNLY